MSIWKFVDTLVLAQFQQLAFQRKCFGRVIDGSRIPQYKEEGLPVSRKRGLRLLGFSDTHLTVEFYHGLEKRTEQIDRSTLPR